VCVGCRCLSLGWLLLYGVLFVSSYVLKFVFSAWVVMIVGSV